MILKMLIKNTTLAPPFQAFYATKSKQTMDKDFKIFPEQASTLAGQVDMLYYILTGLCIFFGILIFVLIYVFAVRYRRRSEEDVPRQIPG